MVTLGGMYISSTPFFSKKNQNYAELASRIGYLPPSPPKLTKSYLITTVPIQNNNPLPMHLTLVPPLRRIILSLTDLQELNQTNNDPDTRSNNLLLSLGSPSLPQNNKTSLQHRRSQSHNIFPHNSS